MNRNKNPSALIGLLLLLMVYILIAAKSSRNDIYLAVIFFLGAASIPFLIKKKTYDCFEIIYLYTIFYFITFGLRAIYLTWFPEAEGRAALDISEVIATAVSYAAIGYLAFFAGYRLPLAQKLCLCLPQLININIAKIRLLIYLMYPLGVIGRLLLIIKGWYLTYETSKFAFEVPAWFGVVGYTYYISLFACSLALLVLFSKECKRSLFFYFWLFIVPFEILWASLIGSKHAFFPLLFMPVAAWHYTKGRITLRHLIIPSIIFIFIVFPFVGAYRTVARYGELKIATFEEDFKHIMNQTKDVVKEDLVSDFFKNSIGVFMERFNGVDSFSYVIMNTPDPIEFQHGRTLVGALAIFVPRFIWPEKDALFVESMRLVPILFGGRYGLTGSGLAISLPGELYWNFHLLGIIMGMFLIGIFSRLIYLYFCQRGTLVGLGIYISQLNHLIFVEGWVAYTYQNLIKQIVIFLILIAIFNGGHIFSKKP